jgi:hypothetical protein
MHRVFRLILPAICIVFLSGCLKSDERYSFYLNGDGSVQGVFVRTNIRSLQTGEKADKELAKYYKSFKDQSERMFVELKGAGAVVKESGFLRSQAPFTTVITADFSGMDTLAKFVSQLSNESVRVEEKDGKGKLVYDAKKPTGGTRNLFKNVKDVQLEFVLEKGRFVRSGSKGFKFSKDYSIAQLNWRNLHSKHSRNRAYTLVLKWDRNLP